ncbi:sulfotransferase [Sphingobium sp.]|uniref:sulfotransferase n=1 Tax=Sphingobium sp. TaxID=1912891 RepID=UPI0035C70B04
MFDDWIDGLRQSCETEESPDADDAQCWLLLDPRNLLNAKGRPHADKLMPVYLRSLVLAASGSQAELRVVARDGLVQVLPMNPSDALARLRALMALWREVLPGRVIEVRYEDLVADQEGQSRRLLAHCGLEWAEECLSFHTNEAPVSTPSAAQVRQPIYRDSVARWKRHGQVMAPVRHFFERSGIFID